MKHRSDKSGAAPPCGLAPEAGHAPCSLNNETGASAECILGSCLDELHEVANALQRLAMLLAIQGLSPVAEKSPYLVAPDSLLTLREAVCLPELGGELSTPGSRSIASTSVRVSTLKQAINRDEIIPIVINNRQFVTRRIIGEWLQSCRDGKRNLISFSEEPGMTRRADSLIAPLGSSKTVTTRFPQDAVAMLLKKLS